MKGMRHEETQSIQLDLGNTVTLFGKVYYALSIPKSKDQVLPTEVKEVIFGITFKDSNNNILDSQGFVNSRFGYGQEISCHWNLRFVGHGNLHN